MHVCVRNQPGWSGAYSISCVSFFFLNAACNFTLQLSVKVHALGYVKLGGLWWALAHFIGGLTNGRVCNWSPVALACW
jgi:hypothetical protein